MINDKNIVQVGFRIPKQLLINALKTSPDNRVHIIVEMNKTTDTGHLTIKSDITHTELAIMAR